MDCDKITSSQNPKIKELLSLRERSSRDESGLTLIDGLREVLCALEANVTLKELYFCKELLHRHNADHVFKKLHTLKVKCVEIPKAIYLKLAYGDRKDGILAVCKPGTFSFKDFVSTENSFFLVVEGVEKPGNLGAIFRVADAVGINGIIICEDKTDLFNPNVIRASIGTVFCVKAVTATRDQAYNFLQTNGIKIYASSPFAKTIYSQVSLSERLAIVIGSEDKGVSDFWIERACANLKIPMRGMADSLNVASSAAILLYEVLRQRK